MKLDTSAWIRIIVSSILIATIIFTLKIIFGMIPEWALLVSVCIPALLNRPVSITDSIIIGILIGILTGVLLSVFYLGPMVFATVFFVIFSIVGALISYFLFEKIFKE